MMSTSVLLRFFSIGAFCVTLASCNEKPGLRWNSCEGAKAVSTPTTVGAGTDLLVQLAEPGVAAGPHGYLDRATEVYLRVGISRCEDRVVNLDLPDARADAVMPAVEELLRWSAAAGGLNRAEAGAARTKNVVALTALAQCALQRASNDQLPAAISAVRRLADRWCLEGATLLEHSAGYSLLSTMAYWWEIRNRALEEQGRPSIPRLPPLSDLVPPHKTFARVLAAEELAFGAKPDRARLATALSELGIGASQRQFMDTLRTSPLAKELAPLLEEAEANYEHYRDIVR